MGLRAIAEQDLGSILEDAAYGFGWPVTLTTPADVEHVLVGFSNDISELIDPDTGQSVSGRVATVALRLSTLKTLGLEWPKSIADTDGKPWRVTFNDIVGTVCTFKISRSSPDRALGTLICHLERYGN